MARKSKSSKKGQSEKEFAVIGLGRFGASLARRLETMGHTVLGVDSDLALVQAISDDITSAVAIDVTNEDALAEVDIASFETAIVALDDDFESSALVVTYLPFGERVLRAWFQSVAARTAGFAGLSDFANLHEASGLLLICLMFIGSAPASARSRWRWSGAPSPCSSSALVWS